ncbi:MAG: hypothetical protein HZB46_17450, partial [Solirubrobacterales bacterium]|nr:hypothetical protein [Solirubrobacterales bacterium]
PPPAPAARPAEAAPDPAPTAVALAEPLGELDLATVGEYWPAVLDTIKERHGMLGAVLVEARPVEVRDRGVIFAFDPSQGFLRKKADDATCRQLVQDAFRELLGVSPRVEYEPRERATEEEGAPPVLTEDQWVARFKQEFDAEEIVPDPEGEA